MRRPSGASSPPFATPCGSTPAGSTGSTCTRCPTATPAPTWPARSTPSSPRWSPRPPRLDATCDAISHGSLMGARGNSGVILSQILRGLTSTLEGSRRRRRGHRFAEALTAAAAGRLPGSAASRSRARSSPSSASRPRRRRLRRPAEPRWSRCCVRRARPASRRSTTRPNCCRCSRMPASSTPAAPASCCCSTRRCTWSTAIAAARARRARRRPDRRSVRARSPTAARGSTASSTSASSATRSCTSSISPTPGSTTSSEGWGAIGDSIVVVGGDGLWNCHVHTNDIGAAIEVALDLDGRPKQIRVTDLFEEVADEHAHRTQACDAMTAAQRRRGAQPCRWRAPGGHDRGRGGVQRRRTRRAVLEPRRPGHRHGRPDAEPVDGRAARHGRARQRRPGRHPAQQQEHHPRRPAGRRAHHQDGASSCRPGRCPRRWRRSWSTTRRRRRAENAAEMTEASRAVATGEVTQAVRDTNSDAGPIKAGDWIGLVRGDGIVAVAVRVEAAATALLDHLVTPGRELVTVITGAEAEPAPRPRSRDGWPTSAPTSRSRSTPAGSRCTRTCSASSDIGATRDGHRSRCATSPTSTSAACAASASRSAPRSRRSGSRPCSTSSPPIRAGGSTARTRPASPTSCPAPRRSCWSACASVTKRLTRNRRTMVNAPGRRRHRSHGGRLLQPAVARDASSPRGCRSRCSARPTTYRGGLQMTNPIVDLIGDRTGRIVPIYPQSEKAQLNTWELAGWIEDALRRCQTAGIADPVPDGGAPAARPGRPRRRRCARSTSPRRCARRRRPAGGWRSTSCCGSSSCS